MQLTTLASTQNMYYMTERSEGMLIRLKALQHVECSPALQLNCVCRRPNNTSQHYAYNNRNLVIESAHYHDDSGSAILINENGYNGSNFRTFEKEIYTLSSSGEFKVSADIYEYDDLHRVTGVKYGADAERTSGISAVNLPLSPGDFDSINNPDLEQDQYIFDLLHP